MMGSSGPNGLNLASLIPDWNIGDMLRQRLSSGPFGAKKGGATQPPPMQTNVPTATGGFYQRQDPAARQALIQAMIARSRGGRISGA